MENNVTQETSLALLHDILIPPAVSYLPLAPGWYALALLVFAYGFHVVMKYGALYRNNLYRREALQELSGLHRGEDAVKEIHILLDLIKRVALQQFGREKVASLSHNEWWDFVEKNSRSKVSTDLRKLSQKILYSPDTQATSEDVKAMVKVAKVWIVTHGVSHG